MAEEKKRVELEAGLMDEKPSDVEAQRQEENEAEVGSELIEEESRGVVKGHGHERTHPPSRLGQVEWDSSDTLSDHRT
jgi:hypothetical protein